jgi:hypothetical protein
MPTANIIVPLILLLSVGCTSSQGFNRAAMSERLQVALPAIPDNQPRSPQNVRPAPPFRLGVFFAAHDTPDTPSIKKIQWLSADRDHLLLELAPLRDEQLITDTFVLMDVTLRSDDIKGIRQAGARFGADMILIVDGVAGIDRYNNYLAWLYPTLIGAYLVPGSESDALVMATGSLWAIRSNWHALLPTVEERSKAVGAAAFLADNAPLQDAKRLAIQTLGRHITEQLRLLATPSPIKN